MSGAVKQATSVQPAVHAQDTRMSEVKSKWKAQLEKHPGAQLRITYADKRKPAYVNKPSELTAAHVNGALHFAVVRSAKSDGKGGIRAGEFRFDVKDPPKRLATPNKADRSGERLRAAELPKPKPTAKPAPLTGMEKNAASAFPNAKTKAARAEATEALQRALYSLKIKCGPVDGRFGPETIKGVQAFNTLYGLPQNTSLSESLRVCSAVASAGGALPVDTIFTPSLRDYEHTRKALRKDIAALVVNKSAKRTKLRALAESLAHLDECAQRLKDTIKPKDRDVEWMLDVTNHPEKLREEG